MALHEEQSGKSVEPIRCPTIDLRSIVPILSCLCSDILWNLLSSPQHQETAAVPQITGTSSKELKAKLKSM